MSIEHEETPREAGPWISLEEALHTLAFGDADQEGDEEERGRALEKAFRDICEAARCSRLKLLGEKPHRRNGDLLGDHVEIPRGLFDDRGAPGVPQFDFPDLLGDETTEPPLAIVWERGGVIKLTWKNVQIDRNQFEQWLEPEAPDPALFDPMRERTWTLAMAVAWLRWGSADAVREQWNTWRAAFPGRREASLAALVEDPPENKMAWGWLLDALQDGRITAMGIRAGSNEGAVPIPAAEWKRLKDHPTGPDLVEKFRYPYTSASPGHGYDEIEVERDDVLQLAPTVGEAAKPIREKKRRGRPPRYTPECKAAAERIAAEKKASRRPSDKTDAALIKAFQAWWEDEHNEPAPVDETVRNWLTIRGL